jgi:predicted small lipoprotein YifL
MKLLLKPMFLLLALAACGREEPKQAPAAPAYAGPKVVKGDTKEAVQAIMGPPTSTGAGIGTGATSWGWASPSLCSADASACHINFSADGLADYESSVLPDHLDVASF